MNFIYKYTTILVLALITISCGKEQSVVQEKTFESDESKMLYAFIEKSGDLINSQEAPFLIMADEVMENKAQYLVIDLRDTSEYEAGHIDGAVLVDAKDLLNYLENKANSSVYEKVVLACHTGQTSSYYTTLLRLIGYNNVFSLKFGMSGWSKKIQPNKIVDNLSDKYTASLEIKANVPDKQYQAPKIETGKKGGYQIMTDRVKTIAGEGFNAARIKIDTLMINPSRYFIVNYWPSDHYDKGHLPGSFMMEPKNSLMKDKMLKYLPTDKEIVVYCLNGQNSASVVAWLRVLGYNAKSLSLGANGFMHNFAASFDEKAFLPSRDIADYELVEGKNPGLINIVPVSSTSAPTTEKETKAPVIKKKQKSSGGGC
ncbi:MAG: rhodanese-like domain-containing protein [Bacteroidales bacterium]